MKVGERSNWKGRVNGEGKGDGQKKRLTAMHVFSLVNFWL